MLVVARFPAQHAHRCMPLRLPPCCRLGLWGAKDALQMIELLNK